MVATLEPINDRILAAAERIRAYLPAIEAADHSALALLSQFATQFAGINCTVESNGEVIDSSHCPWPMRDKLAFLAWLESEASKPLRRKAIALRWTHLE